MKKQRNIQKSIEGCQMVQKEINKDIISSKNKQKHSIVMSIILFIMGLYFLSIHTPFVYYIPLVVLLLSIRVLYVKYRTAIIMNKVFIELYEGDIRELKIKNITS